jgi:hypothetical protein
MTLASLVPSARSVANGRLRLSTDDPFRPASPACPHLRRRHPSHRPTNPHGLDRHPRKQHYAGLPPTAQAKLNRCRDRLQDGTYAAVPAGLRDFLVGRLTPDAAERHIAAGLGATAALEALQNQRLTRPDGGRRRVAVIPTGELIDRYGRLLAYLAP